MRKCHVTAALVMARLAIRKATAETTWYVIGNSASRCMYAHHQSTGNDYLGKTVEAVHATFGVDGTWRWIAS